jgi:hypothetical protein
VLPDEPLDATLADAVALGQAPFRRTHGEGSNELLQVGLTQPVPDPPRAMAPARVCAGDRFSALGLRLLKLLHRADQHVCEVTAFGISLYKVHPAGSGL